MKRFVLALAALTVAATTVTATGALAGTGCPATAGGSLRQCVVATGSAAGDYATTVTAGTVNRPRSVVVVVYTSSAQSVAVSWTMVCTRGLGAGSKSGQFTISTHRDGSGGPLHQPGAWSMRNLAAPPMNGSDSCTVSADGQLSGSGSLRLELLGIQR